MSEVYFILSPELGLVKIGYASSAIKRFSKVQSDSPTRLQLIGIEDGDRDREAELHLLFANQRERGEWFRFDEKLEAYVAALAPRQLKRRRKLLGGKLGQWLHENGKTSCEFADSIGVSQAAISRFCAGKQLPRRDIMLRIVAATDGKVTPNDFFGIAA